MGSLTPETAGQLKLARPFFSFRPWEGLATLTVLAAALRLAFLGRWSLWLDELWTVYVANRYGLGNIAAPLDQHPPLYYVWQNYWLRLGHSEAWLRLPSALAGAGAVAVLYLTGRALGQTRLGWLAGLLLAVSPIHVWYSREARMYGLASLMWALSLYYFVQIWRRGGGLDVLGLAASTLAGLYLTYATLALWVLGLGGAGLAWHLAGRPRGRVARWGVAQVLIGLGALAWWPVLLHQLQRNVVFNWQLPATLGPPLGGLGLVLNLSQTLVAALAAAGGVLTGLLVLSAWLARRPRPWVVDGPRVARLAIAIVAVFAVLGALGAVPRGLSIRRQLLVLWPLGVAAAAWALAYLNRRWLTSVVAGGLLVLSALMVLGPAYEDYRGALRYVTQHAAPGDTLALHPSYLAPIFGYYGEGLPPYVGVDPRTTPPQLPLAPDAADGQVWLLLMQPERHDADGAVLGWFDAHGERLDSRVFSRVVVYRFAWR
jgi:mannosyltransferase